ncbi:MAG: DUF502 domain-containing protein [Halofilum sp. (in: g-proteobacteria)]
MSAQGRVFESVWGTFLSGLLTLLPIAITLYLIGWLASLLESLFGVIPEAILPESWYVPGMGILLGVVVIFLVGAFLKAWIFRRLIEKGEEVLENLPVVKTVYTGLRDLLDFVSNARERGDLKRVVSVEIQPGVSVIGFVTDDHAGESFPELAVDGDDADHLVSVYLPMGYQVGGYTLYLPTSRLKTLDLTVEEAMRVVLTAGVNRPRRPDEGPTVVSPAGTQPAAGDSPSAS